MYFYIDVGEINKNREAGLEVKPNGRVKLFPRPGNFKSHPQEFQRVVGDIFAFATDQPEDKKGVIEFQLEKNGERNRVDMFHGEAAPRLLEIDGAVLWVKFVK